MSGAVAQSQNLDVIANNLANTDTPAFKKDMPTFKEYLAVQEREHTPQEIPRAALKDADFYLLDGRDQSHVVMQGVHTSLKPGHLKVTHRSLDVALDGPGFFEVSTPSGIRYTRQGSFKIGTDGKLLTSEGYPVLASQAAGLGGVVGPGGNPANPSNPAARYISLAELGGQFNISEQGEVYGKEGLVATLSIVEFDNESKLRKVGGLLFEETTPAGSPVNRHPAQKTILHQGVLEMSNVNPIEEMTNMIKTNRIFEQDLKAMKTYSELLAKEANEVGKL